MLFFYLYINTFPAKLDDYYQYRWPHYEITGCEETWWQIPQINGSLLSLNGYEGVIISEFLTHSLWFY